MFYKTGIDITNDKQMFNFLKNHFEYYTMNSWNRRSSIANNVKLHRLNLTGDWCVALSLLEAGEYDTISLMIRDWEQDHPSFEVCFNGRSNGYLVLHNIHNNVHVLPMEIVESEDYDEYKRWCREHYSTVKAYRESLVFYTKLVQDFDRLCDDLRSYCDQLSQRSFEIVEMQKAVDQFNEDYSNDLEYLDFQCLKMDADGCVDVSEICQLTCLYEAFLKVADRSKVGYKLEYLPDWRIKLKSA
jgi:hypothetical protein